MAQTLSILIVTHNSASHLAACLNSIPRAYNGTPELIVVDNASTDTTLEILHACEFRPIVVTNKTNTGFAKAVNLAANNANGEFLVLLNPDTMLDDGAIDTLVESARISLNAGLLVPRFRTPSGSFHPTCRQLPDGLNMLSSRGSILTKLFRISSRHYTLPDVSVTTQVPAVAATALLVSRDIWNKLGGFDERFFLYMEDTDLSLRASQQGLRNYIVPAAGAIHFWGGGSTMPHVFRSALQHYAVWQYYLKHAPNGFSLILLPLLLTTNWLLTSILSLVRR